MYNFKFNFLSRGQLESLNLDRIFVPLFKVLPCYEGFLVTSFLPLLLEYCAEIILNSQIDHKSDSCNVFQAPIRRRHKFHQIKPVPVSEQMAPDGMELLFKDMRTWRSDASTVLQRESKSGPRTIQNRERKQMQRPKTKGASKSML